jgi:hypothetical protein
MKRRLYFTLLFLALLLIAIPGFAAKAVRRATRAVALRPTG